MKLFCPVPDSVSLDQPHRMISSVMKFHPFKLTEETMVSLIEAEERMCACLAGLEKYSLSQAHKNHENAQNKLRDVPSIENQEAVRKLGSRDFLIADHERMRNSLQNAGAAFAEKIVTPLCVRILEEACLVMELEAKLNEGYDNGLYTRLGFNSPNEFISFAAAHIPSPVALVNRLPLVPTLVHPVVVALRRQIKMIRAHCVDLELVGCIGPVAPSSLLLGIVHFEYE